jgi:hypothetical protein
MNNHQVAVSEKKETNTKKTTVWLYSYIFFQGLPSMIREL